MHGCPAHGDMAQLPQHPQHDSGIGGHHIRRHDRLPALLPLTAAFPLYPIHQGPILLRLQECHCSHRLLGDFRKYAGEGRWHDQ